jgi:N6-L-threonylcarbamoyladenine synthase
VRVLGIETSCDECAASVVEDGRRILSNVVLTQIPFHAGYSGVVPEIASRKHTEWILDVARRAIADAGLSPQDIDAAAATAHPGLSGSLLVGHTFAKGFAWAQNIPFVSCDHLLAHLYASNLTGKDLPPSAIDTPYPFLGLLVSGGHTVICRVDNFDRVIPLGTTLDDAAGEGFDKVARYYGLGYPGGKYIDELAQSGNAGAFKFPLPNLDKTGRKYDVSYSGLKTAAVNQLRLFCVKNEYRDMLADGKIKPCDMSPQMKADIAASFQKTAVDILLRALLRAVEDTGINLVVTGGGVAANSHLRARLAAIPDLRCVFPPAALCGDNGAMVAGLAFRYLERGETSPFSSTISARVSLFKRLP